MLKALIVDDEAPARAELRYLLEGMEGVRVVGEATNAEEALELARALHYDAIFIDVQMPGLTGLEAANRLRTTDGTPAIVFVTAYSEHAVKAFELDAVDYLVKPIDEDRLALTINKLVRQRNGRSHQQEQVDIEIERIPVESRGKTILLPIGDIVFVNSKSDLVFAHTADSTYLTRFTLKDLEGRLRNRGFFRTHRAYLVNLHHVEEIVPMWGQNYMLRVSCAKQNEVPVSRRRSQKLKSILGM
ncbi:MAG: LytR/AlgR family response regulator transcription factor [Candidatus Aquicultorales bacterium]